MGLFDSKATQKNTTVPWQAAQPYLKKIMGSASGLYKSGAGFNAPNFQTYVPQSGATKQALAGTAGVAQGGNPMQAQAEGTLGGMFAGGGLDQQMQDLYANSGNPAFAGAVDTQAGKLSTDLQRPWSGLGRYGSGAMQNDMAQNIGDFRQKAISDQWNQNVANQRGILGDISGNRQFAIGAAPGVYENRYAPYQHLAQVGAAREDLATRKLQARMDKFQARQQAPWNRLGAFQGAVTGSSAGSGTTTQTSQQPTNWAGILGGLALGGASLLRSPLRL